MENEQNNPNQAANEPQGKRENEQDHYSSLASDGPVSQSGAQGKSNLQDNQNDPQETDEIAGDLSGNAAGNSDAEDQ